MVKPDHALVNALEVYRERNRVYRDAYLTVGKVTSALFPNGVALKTEDDHNRWHLLELIIVKLTRYAANWEHGHPDSMTDLMVYGAMIQALDVNSKKDYEITMKPKEET